MGLPHFADQPEFIRCFEAEAQLVDMKGIYYTNSR